MELISILGTKGLSWRYILLFSLMSLKLEQLEASLDRLLNSYLPRALFHFPKDLLCLKAEFDKLKRKRDSGTYGPKTTNRVDALINRWNVEVQSVYAFPPQNSDMLQVMIWTLDQLGFRVTNRIEGPDVSVYSLVKNDLKAQLKLISFPQHTVLHLDRFKLVVKIDASDLSNLPLRFAVACAYPLITDCPVPEVRALPQEVLRDISLFLEPEELGKLGLTCKSLRDICDSDSVWSHIFNHMSDYTNCSATAGDVDASISAKNRVKKLVTARQRLRMMRFSNFVEASDWAMPNVVWEESVHPVRMRRPLDVMDDLDLF